MGDTRTRVPPVATRRIRLTTSPEPATCLHSQNARGEDAGYLASISHRLTRG
jgi:hypothetical protein